MKYPPIKIVKRKDKGYCVISQIALKPLTIIAEYLGYIMTT